MRYADETLRLMRETGEIDWCPQQDSKIVEFYKDKNVLVTGATGFLGKLLVEKLLRACPDIKSVFILVRPKKGEDEHHRVDKLYSDQIFGPLTKLFPKFQHKINIIKGDISLPNLGLSPSDVSLITEQVNIIFHVAATVRFDEKITIATAINVRGTRDLLTIAKQCKNLESFVHVSTAYANCNRPEIDEVFCKQPITADELIEMVEKTPESVMLERTLMLTKGWPNTYTYTKAIAEDAVAHYGKGLPVCVVRPAVVIATYKEPLRSWIDNLYGATGIIVGAGTGLLRTIYGDRYKSAELVPGDYVINSMIAASYKTAKDKTPNIPIYNYVSSVENRIDWVDVTENCKKWGLEIPSTKCVWYYCLTINNIYLVHLLATIFLHFLPALIMDFGMIVARKRPIMVKIYKKIVKFESVISHFVANQWTFHNDNTQALWTYLGESDQKMFPFSIKQMDWNEFWKTHMLGLRTYLVKDDIGTIPQAQVKWRRFYVAHQIVKGLFYFSLLYSAYLVLARIVM